MDHFPAYGDARNDDVVTTMRAKFILCCVLLSVARMVWADGGAIQFQGDAGAFRVTVFTQPPFLRAGLIDLTLLLQDRS